MTRSATCRTLLIVALGIAAIACDDRHQPGPTTPSNPAPPAGCSQSWVWAGPS